MYFDIEVKENLDDLFNYRQELQALLEAIKTQKLVVVSGLRRVGKTSLMRVAFHQWEGPKVFLDARGSGEPKALLNRGLLDIYAQVEPSQKIFEVVEAVDLGPFTLRLGSPRIHLEDIEARLHQRAALFIDEMPTCPGLDSLIAHLYDYTRHFTVVVSGSEVGLLDDLFSPGKPLFGRLHSRIQLKPLPPEKAEEFLRLGFAQEGKEYREEQIREAVKELDGLIGWLTYYGYLRRRASHSAAMEILRKNARLLLMAEVESFLRSKRGERTRYLYLLRILKIPLTWSEVKERLEFNLGKRISNSRLSAYLTELLRHGFVVKEEGGYRLADPLLRLL